MSDNNNTGPQLYRYEDILRAIGRYIDENQMQDVVVLQGDPGVTVHGFRNVSASGGVRPRLVEYSFNAEEIKLIDEESRKRRGKGSKLFGD